MRRIFIPAMLCALAVPSMAGAATYGTSASEREMLNSLPPGMEQYVEMRMGPEQRVPELVETTVLNQLAQEHAGVRNLVRYGDTFSAEVLSPEGIWVPITVRATDIMT